jgi:dTMP kinase
VTQTGLARSSLVGPGLQRAKQGHTLGDITLNLFYATDFADRLEKEIIPALRAGFVCLTDRYIYSDHRPGARPRHAYATGCATCSALRSCRTRFYLEADLEHLVPRVLSARGSTTGSRAWMYCAEMTSSRTGTQYQTQLLAQFRQIAKEYHFITIDANRSVHEIFSDLRKRSAG